MKRCFACHITKPETEFPSSGSLTCKFCTPPNIGQHPAILKVNDPDFAYGSLGPIRIPERPARPDHDLANMLMRISRANTKAKVVMPPLWDDRPLIDQLHEATYTDAPGLQWVTDKYALRMMLRKAHCFTLDDDTSKLVADFSVAVSGDLEASRRMAIPPFPVTWIDLNNRVRLNRMDELGVALTQQARGETDAGPPVDRVGWLICPGSELNSYFATYVTRVDNGVVAAPMPYWWHTLEANPSNATRDYDKAHHMMMALTFGIATSNVHPYDACISSKFLKHELDKFEVDMMSEIAGELRHVWGFLIALGAGQLGTEIKYSPQPTSKRAPVIKNGKPLLPLEHKVLHLHLSKRMTPAKVVVRMMTHHKLRWHEVRSHFRTLRNPDGTVRKRIPIAAHERGDERLGRVEKTYKVEK